MDEDGIRLSMQTNSLVQTCFSLGDVIQLFERSILSNTLGSHITLLARIRVMSLISIIFEQKKQVSNKSKSNIVKPDRYWDSFFIVDKQPINKN